MSSLFASGVCVLEEPQAILFDKDGTLIDVHHYWSSMVRLRAEIATSRWDETLSGQPDFIPRFMEALGVDLRTGRMKPEGPVGVKARPQVVAIATAVLTGHGIATSAVEVEKVFQEADVQSAENMAPLLIILPGVEKFLVEACKRNIKLEIVSTDITARVCKSMDTLGLTSYFNGLFGGDSVARTKPAPDLANKVIALGGYDPRRVAVIGDHPVDIKMGLAADINCNIGVLTGLSSAADFGTQASVIVKDFTELNFG